MAVAGDASRVGILGELYMSAPLPLQMISPGRFRRGRIPQIVSKVATPELPLFLFFSSFFPREIVQFLPPTMGANNKFDKLVEGELRETSPSCIGDPRHVLGHVDEEQPTIFIVFEYCGT